ncbi:hypothetical protein OH76DRAFT_1480607 [Lentinus brumalis]|uniref:DUF4470 domain-containing protein n=1 Tax=Lentinus brumalis TaxID=2498619 RepID=A0A371DIZ6_9APHY|nr:hypothetical protein OH76DRAFT_1480607 [Polyporus brumalis]
MSEDPAVLKNRGNELFRAGAFQEASNMYAQAEQAEPSNPVYASNLSAALLELGDYVGCLKSVLRAWRSLRSQPDQQGQLVTRLAKRLTKALCHGARAGTITGDTLATHREGIDQLRVASSCPASNSADELVVQGWMEWDVTSVEMDEYLEKRDTCRDGLSCMPIFFKPLDDTKEYYGIGHDHFIDLTAGWGMNDAQPLDFEALSIENLRSIAVLYGGVGDARHVLATLSGLSIAYNELSDDRKENVHVHLTLLDINDTTIARDLCLFMLLDELNRASDMVEKAEIKMTLMCMFCGAVMPSYCYNRLTRLFTDLSQRLSSSAWELPTWISLDQRSATGVVHALEYWLTASKSTQKILAEHEIPLPRSRREPLANFRPGEQPELKQRLEEKLANERQIIRDTLLNMSHEKLLASLVDSGLVSPYVSPAAARAALHDNIDALIDKYQEPLFGGPRTVEMEWYRLMKVFVLPEVLRSRHPDLDTLWKQVRSAQSLSHLVAREHVENDWQPNITLFDWYFDDPNCVYDEARTGYPNMKEDVFGVIQRMHNFNTQEHMPLYFEALAWDVCSVFFEKAAAALKAMESKVILEFMQGEICEELAQMRCDRDTTRPRKFPKKYTRMWLSNVPDYTHGPLNMIVYVAPNLQDHPQAALACNSLLNTSAWKDDEEYWHTYTLLTINEVPRYLGCNIISSSAVMDVLVLGSSPSFPRPLGDLASRDELMTWLTRLLFNTLIPGRTEPPPCNIRLPHNLVAFFGLLMYLSRIGYPGHWLSEFVARIFSGRMVSDIPPYTGEYPIAVEERTRRVPSRAVRTDPWLVEFETILATAYHAIPFPIAGALPSDFSNNSNDIAVWEAKVRPRPDFSPRGGFYSSPHHTCAQLLFYRSDKLTAREVIDHMHDIFEGKLTPSPGSFFVLTAPEHVVYWDKIRFRLSRQRVERMRAEKWSMVAYRNDTGMQATLPSPVSSWTVKEHVA